MSGWGKVGGGWGEVGMGHRRVGNLHSEAPGRCTKECTLHGSVKRDIYIMPSINSSFAKLN